MEPLPATPPTPEPPTGGPLPTADPEGVRWNFVALGGDWRPWRVGTAYGNKTDVMLIMSVLVPPKTEDPIEITMIQVPRNLYVPTSLGDYWAFAIYGLFGFDGIHTYMEEVFGIDIIGVGYIHMQNFERLVDSFPGDGLFVEGEGVMDGEEVLAYLRDNENSWDYGLYDYEGRHFKVLEALASRFKTEFHENALVTAANLWDNYGELFETDLTNFEQIHWLAELGWFIAVSEYDVVKVRLWEPAIVYGDVPLEVRGWKEATPGYLKIWIQEVFNRAITD